MSVHFFKYQATGNDFVIIDNRAPARRFSTDQIGQVCDRRFGVGADGLILIENDPAQNFSLVYYNADGTQSLCGNGCRAAVQLASSLGLVNGKASFTAFDGVHQAEIVRPGMVRLRMHDVSKVDKLGDDFYLNTGSPHYVRFVDEVRSYPVVEEGRKIRHDERFHPGGTNANFVQRLDNNTIFVRTYERGVEDETLSCGTGIVASAIAASYRGFLSPVHVQAPGGSLSVEFRNEQPAGSSGHDGTFVDIFLTGPAKLVFEGDLEL